MHLNFNLRVLIIASIGISFGCSSVKIAHSDPNPALIESQFAKLDVSHGVSREDAVVIAQHYMLSKGYDYDWFVAAPKKVTDDPVKNIWTVEFEPKEDGYGSGPRKKSEIELQMLLSCWVNVNKTTGEISYLVFRTKNK